MNKSENRILLRTDSMAFVDSQNMFGTEINLKCKQLSFKSSVFDIQIPFYSYEACEINSNDIHIKRKRRRKRKENLTSDIDLSQFIHESFKICLEKVSGYFSANSDASECNNENARILANQVEIFTKLADKTHMIKYSSDEIPKYFHELVTNDGESWIEITCLNDKYIMPPHSAFVMCDIQYCSTILTEKCENFDFIVIDPPWVNKSVKKNRNYYMLNDIDILRLPIRKLIKSTGIVAIWSTGSEKIQRQLFDQILPAWNLHLLGTWYWLKVTKFGQPVLDIDNTFRHPYEFLHITCPNIQSTINMYNSVPQKFCFISIPACIHSSKPPIFDLVSNYLPASKKAQCLELFARNLSTGFTSWGNEPIKLQKSDLLFYLNDRK